MSITVSTCIQGSRVSTGAVALSTFHVDRNSGNRLVGKRIVSSSQLAHFQSFCQHGLVNASIFRGVRVSRIESKYDMLKCVCNTRYTLNKHIKFWRCISDTLSKRKSTRVVLFILILFAARKIFVPAKLSKNKINI